MNNKFQILLLFLLLQSVIAMGSFQDILINEVSYSNKTTLIDNDGDTPDWIEIYNPTEEKVNLIGYQLTDDLSDTVFWSFPDIILEAKSFMLVYASGKNRVDEGELHTNFRLSLMQDSLFLLNPEGTIIDQVNADCVPKDLSIGRQPNGSLTRRVLIPTPGFSNDTAKIVEINYQADTLISSHSSGFYNNPIHLEFSNGNMANSIRYTLDGDIPDEDSYEYSQTAIYLDDLTPSENRFANIPETYKKPGDAISKANIVRAVVYSDGCPASNVITNTYYIGEHLKNKYHIPVISLITESDNLFDDNIGIYVYGNHQNYSQRGKEWERPVHVEMFDSVGFQFIDQDAGVRISGKGSRAAPQKPLRLYAKEKYGKEHFEYPFFKQKPELNKFETLLLRSTRGLSGTIFKDELTQNLVQDMQIDYSGTQPVVVFLNGEYWGIYSLRERLDEGYVENNFRIAEPVIDVLSHDLGGVSLEKGSWDDYDNLTLFLQNSNPADENFFDEVSAMIDISQAIDYYIAELYFANYDFPHNNLKLWKAKNDTALWRHFFFDCDACMIYPNHNLFTELNNQEVELFQKHPEWAVSFIQVLLQNPQFHTLFMIQYYYHLQNTFNTGNIIDEIDRLEELYKPMVAEHTYRWHQPEDIIKWLNNVEMLRIFAMQRPSYVIDQLKENFENPFTMYPNPGNGDITFVSLLDETEEYSLKIFDMSGKLFVYETLVGQEFSLETNLSSGLYIVHFVYNGLIFSEKLVVY